MSSKTVILSTILFLAGAMLGGAVTLGVASMSIPTVGTTHFGEVMLGDSVYVSRFVRVKGRVGVDAMQLPHGCILWVPTTAKSFRDSTAYLHVPALPGPDKPLD